MPFTFAAFLIASVSIIGLPPGGGAWSKWFLAVGTARNTSIRMLTAALMVSSLLNIAYLVPIPIRAFMAKKKQKDKDEHDSHTEHDTEKQGIAEAPWMCVVPLCLTAIGSVILFFCAGWIYEALLPITK